MEIGPIRNQNLIFWPLAVKIAEEQQKIKIVRTNRQSNLHQFGAGRKLMGCP